MKGSNHSIDRRGFLGAGLGAAGVMLGGVFYQVPGAYAEYLELARTPTVTEGPFYPDKLPLDTDNDLIIINKSVTPAIGEITHLTGKILSTSGEPMKDVVIEIWQCDGNGVYLHSLDSNTRKEKQDKNFQGFGRFTTNAKGEYRFRTIKPVAYPGRPAPHIHYKVKKGDKTLLTSQIFIAGLPANNKDGIFKDIRNEKDRELVQTSFNKIKDSKTGEYAASFDIVVGLTPEEKQER